jgi:hypothetical protein
VAYPSIGLRLGLVAFRVVAGEGRTPLGPLGFLDFEATWLLRVPPTGSGGTPSCARPVLRQITEAAELTKPERCWAHAPISVLDLRFELSPLFFIYIMARVK